MAEDIGASSSGERGSVSITSGGGSGPSSVESGPSAISGGASADTTAKAPAPSGNSGGELPGDRADGSSLPKGSPAEFDSYSSQLKEEGPPGGTKTIVAHNSENFIVDGNARGDHGVVNFLGAEDSKNGKIIGNDGSNNTIVVANSEDIKVHTGTGDNFVRTSGENIAIDARSSWSNMITIEPRPHTDLLNLNTDYKFEDPATGKSVKNDPKGEFMGITNEEQLTRRSYDDLNNNITIDARGSRSTVVNIDDSVRNAQLRGDSNDVVNYASPNRAELTVKALGDGYSMGVADEKAPIITVNGDDKGVPHLLIDGKEIPLKDIRAAIGGLNIQADPGEHYTVASFTPALPQGRAGQER